MEPVRTALIGCGKVGGVHAAALAGMSEARLVGHCDASRERAESFAARYGGRAFTDVPSLLQESGAEAAIVATPHPLHAEPAIRAAEAGVHVLVEKPLAACLIDCDAMLAAAARSGVTLGVVSQRRFAGPVLRMRAAIDAGKIGKPALGAILMFNWRDEAYYRSDPWRGRWDTEGGGVLVNQSPHHLDLLRWFMGPVEEVGGTWANLNHPYVEVEDTALATLRFRGGGVGSVIVSLSQKPGLWSKVHIHGTNGSSIGVETDRGATFVAGMSAPVEPPLNDVWTIPGEEGLLPRFQAEDRAAFGAIDPITHYHALQLRDFLRALREGRPPLVTGEDGRAVVELFTAIYRAGRERRAIALPVAAESATVRELPARASGRGSRPGSA
jgi:predicted dehydrogenase